MSLLEDANLIVSKHQQIYYEVLADMYFMALLSRDYNEANKVWRDAQMLDSYFLSSALASARQQASTLTHLSRSRIIPQRSSTRTRRHSCCRPSRRSCHR